MKTQSIVVFTATTVGEEVWRTDDGEYVTNDAIMDRIGYIVLRDLDRAIGTRLRLELVEVPK